jgi:hypothetical protein
MDGPNGGTPSATIERTSLHRNIKGIRYMGIGSRTDRVLRDGDRTTTDGGLGPTVKKESEELYGDVDTRRMNYVDTSWLGLESSHYGFGCALWADGKKMSWTTRRGS